jgi:hypothetical protein
MWHVIINSLFLQYTNDLTANEMSYVFLIHEFMVLIILPWAKNKLNAILQCAFMALYLGFEFVFGQYILGLLHTTHIGCILKYSFLSFLWVKSVGKRLYSSLFVHPELMWSQLLHKLMVSWVYGFRAMKIFFSAFLLSDST